MHRKDGVIKLDSTPINKITGKSVIGTTASGGILMAQNRDASNVVKKQLISSPSSVNPVKVTSKPDGTQVITQMKVVPKTAVKGITSLGGKNEGTRIQPKIDGTQQIQQIHVVAAVSQTATKSPATSGVRTPGSQQSVTHRTADGRIITRTPVNNVMVGSPLRVAPQNRTPQQTIQRRVVQATSSGIAQVSPPTAIPVRPKITVMNNQGNVIQKTTGNLPNAASKKKPQTQSIVNKAMQKAGVATPNNRGKAANEPKETAKLTSTTLQQQQQPQSDESSSEDEAPFPPINEPSQAQQEEESPERFTLCPLTGRIIDSEGRPVAEQPLVEPVPVPEPTPTGIVQVVATTSGGAAILDTITSSPLNESGEILPSLDGMMRVEMSPGGTTGMLVTTSSGDIQVSYNKKEN